MFDVANQVTKAQRIMFEGIFDAYQKKADFLKFFQQVTEEVQTNYKGRTVVLETKANPSLSSGNPDGGALATPSNPTLDNFTLTYQWLNSGFERSYAAELNNNKETVGDPLEKAAESSAKQFAQWLNYYVSAGNGTTALATCSASYSGGTPTIFTCNGSTDGFGATRVVDGQRGYLYDPTGTTQRVGTVGAGVLTISSHTKTVITFSSNAPSDFVSGDIFVPEGTNTTGIKGLPYLAGNTGNYFDKSRSSVTQLQSTVISPSSALSSLLLLKLFAQTMQNAGRDEEDTGWITLAAAFAQWVAYYQLTTTSPQSHIFQHTEQAPQIDVGGKSFMFTWFGSRIRRFLQLKATDFYLLDMSVFKMAVLKKVGPMAMPAGDFIQSIDASTSLYKAAQAKWTDFAGDSYVQTPHVLGVLNTLDLTNLPLQKS